MDEPTLTHTSLLFEVHSLHWGLLLLLDFLRVWGKVSIIAVLVQSIFTALKLLCALPVSFLLLFNPGNH